MNRPLRIAFIVQFLSIGGIETRLLKLLRAIDRERFEPYLICASDDGLQSEAFKALGIPIITTHGLLPINRLLQIFYLIKLMGHLGGRRFDVLMSFLPTSQPFENWLASFCVRHQAFAFGLVINFRMGRDKDWETRARLARVIVSVSKGSALAIYGESACQSKIRVIPNGVDVYRYDKKRLGNSSDIGAHGAVRLTICCVARLAPQKRYDVLLDALVLLRESATNFRCLVAGQDRLNGWFQERVVELELAEHVVYLGPWEDVPSLLASSDIFVLTSDNEGCPNAMLEAMSTGLPIVATRSGSEEFLVEGQTGFVVPIGDAQAVAERLACLMGDEDLRLHMGAAAREWIIQNAALDSMLASYFKLFEELGGSN